MKNFKFNEKYDIENMIANGFVDETNYKHTISKLALYNLKALGMDKEDNYDAIKEYMTLQAVDFFEPEYQKIIYGAIASSKQRILRDIDCVNITKSELTKISDLNNIRKEKIAFVLVATAKYYDAIKKIDEHYTNLTNAEICKFARITMRTSDRDSFMSFIYDDDIVARHLRPNGTGKKIKIVSDDKDDEIVLSLSEVDFEELAYIYLDYKNNHVGYARCEKCGRIFKQNKAKTRKYCESCDKYDPIGDKVISCIDCGKKIQVPNFDTHTCRCSECQSLHRYTPVETKKIRCIDCGKEFEVDSKDTKTCRCEECYKKERNKYMKELMRKKRANN